MKSEIDLSLAIRYFQGICTQEERRRIETWVSDNPDHNAELEAFRRLWNDTGDEKFNVDINAAWDRVSERTGINTSISTMPSSDQRTADRKSSFSSFFRTVAAAVVLLGVISATYWYWNSSDSKHLILKEVSTKRGERVKLQFADGTTVQLNTFSTIRFPEEFSSDVREVWLRGEAFFDVARNEQLPFIVRTEHAVVKVLGTGFNVEAWPDENHVDVVVSQGKVSVRSATLSTNREVILTDGEQSIIAEGKSPTEALHVQIDEYLSWIDGKLQFRRTPLPDVLKQLERRYDVHFTVKDSTLMLRTLTASVKDESLPEVLTLIALSLNARYEKEGTVVTLSVDSQSQGSKKQRVH